MDQRQVDIKRIGRGDENRWLYSAPNKQPHKGKPPGLPVGLGAMKKDRL